MRKSYKDYEGYLNSLEYKMTQKLCYNKDIGTYHSYGICVTGRDYELTINDITVNRDVIVKTLYLFNRYKPSPSHIYEIIEDFIF